MFDGKNILITGGAGSVGSEICNKLLGQAKVIRLFDNDENGLFLQQQKFGKEKNVRYFLGDIRDSTRLKRALDNVDIVFHCAALKHVWSCEYNPFEAMKTNVEGLQNVIEASMEAEVEKFIFTSSDKAANPTNVMGTTKLLGEKLVTAANYYKGNRKTVFSTIRFGNVLGSSGSVIPVFNEQIKNNGPLTLTHPEMTRFVMPMNKAIELVFKATEMAKGGEVFIFKMPALSIKDLADAMIHESGKKIKVEELGTKPGEKMYEELLTDEEIKRSLETEDMFIILPQLAEVFNVGGKSYSNAKKPSLDAYTSKDSKLLSKEDIKELLKKEKLL
jgi:FlaA1/EpsC-like NDP-sugar epimerase